MKQILTYFFARFFNWFKFKSPALYTTVLGFLIWAQTQLADPVVLQEIIESLDGAPGFVIKLIKWSPAILMGLIAPHTSEVVKKGRPARNKQ